MKTLVCISPICPIADICKLSIENKKLDKRKYIITDFYYLIYHNGKSWTCQQRELQEGNIK